MKKIELKNEVKGLIETHLKLKQISQNKLAEMIGVSPATISNILNEFWERVKDSMLLKIRSFFNPKNWNVIETHNFTTIQNACKESRKNNRLMGVIGYTGAGKTTSMRHYYQNNVNTYLVTCGRSMRTKQFLSEILKSLGINFLASDYEMVRYIIDELNKKDQPLLIIDEASKLSPNALMYLQDIWDGIEDNAGLIIAGVEYLLTNIKKGAERNKIGMPEFYGRVSKWITLQLPSRDEVKAICTNNGIEDMQYIKEMYRLGNYRHLKNAINNHLNPI